MDISSLLVSKTAWLNCLKAACLISLAIGPDFSASGQSGPELNTELFYQGQLLEAGERANGVYEFRFALADSPVAGNIVGQAITNSSVIVSNGMFGASLNFGADVFNGPARWLDVSVRTNGAVQEFTPLQPRQPMWAVPYAIYAGASRVSDTAATLASGGATLTNIPGAFIKGTIPLQALPRINSDHLDPTLDALYRSGASNRLSVINVRDFGAKGDGITDDTLALSNAWNVFSASGGTLYFPPGTYLDSGTHEIRSGAPNATTAYRDGRLILGLGNARWKYTGASRLIYFTSSAPDIDGIEFIGSQAATNCIYISHVLGTPSIRNCFFNYWPAVTVGALVLDEADNVDLINDYAFLCRIGFGFGFRCNNLRADIQTYACVVGTAIGIPTQNSPLRRDSHNIDLNVMSLYCSNGVAMDAEIASTSIRGYFWNNTNACVMVGSIPGVSTNYDNLVSLTLHHSYFQGANYFQSPIKLYSGFYRSFDIISCRFDQSPNSAPLIKSYSAGGDIAPISWVSNFRNGSRPQFEDSSGRSLSELGAFQSQSLNRTVGIYNWRSQTGLGGSGYMLDVLDASRSGPIARIGASGDPSSPSFSQFLGGLLVRYDSGTGRPEVAITNADFVLSGPGTVLSPTDPGKPGMIRWDENFLYISVGTNQWRRAPFSAW